MTQTIEIPFCEEGQGRMSGLAVSAGTSVHPLGQCGFSVTQVGSVVWNEGALSLSSLVSWMAGERATVPGSLLRVLPLELPGCSVC